ncbi:MAG: malonyl-CoA decarboxylase [Paracoccaceae bacterium]|nr:MAG: malonyl-CoA decarboxylase [Paracoccaceae bacterium]
MKAAALFSDLLGKVAEIGRAMSLTDGPGDTLADRCAALLAGQGEATGLALARDILDRFAQLDPNGKRAFLTEVQGRFGVDRAALDRALDAYRQADDDITARAIHFAGEPRSQELIRRLNRAPNGTRDLVAMRSDLLQAMRLDPALGTLDADFRHLLGSWFNRGFLELRRIDWTTPAAILEKVIAYEAVHTITGWDDLRRRVAAPDRLLYAFFHPAMRDEPLIFVEVALETAIPAAIGPILSEDRRAIDPAAATVAAFYSISNCQAGLRGISFGNFLIKQVVEELRQGFPGLRTFVTLSPVPGLRRWVAAEMTRGEEGVLSVDERAALTDGALADGGADHGGMPPPDHAASIAARYLLQGRNAAGMPADPVARFHLGNGARLERINLSADPGARARDESWGIMVNYLYDLATIEKNHEAFANRGVIAASPPLRRLVRQR